MAKINLLKELAHADGLNLSTRTDPGLEIWLDELNDRLHGEMMIRPDYKKIEFEIWNIISILTVGNSSKATTGTKAILKALHIEDK